MIGIANSIELFTGELQTAEKICANELKLLFKPYTREDLATVLSSLAAEAIPKIHEVIAPKAFLLAASKIDKISGDIRVCFEIMRQTI